MRKTRLSSIPIYMAKVGSPYRVLATSDSRLNYFSNKPCARALCARLARKWGSRRFRSQSCSHRPSSHLTLTTFAPKFAYYLEYFSFFKREKKNYLECFSFFKREKNYLECFSFLKCEKSVTTLVIGGSERGKCEVRTRTVRTRLGAKPASSENDVHSFFSVVAFFRPRL